MNDNSYSRMPIGDLVSRVETWNPQRAAHDLEFDYIDIASIDRESKTITQTTRVNAHDAPSRARQRVKANDILVSTVRPNLNAVAFVPDELNDAIASTGYCVLRCVPDRLDCRYLYHWVRTLEFAGEMTRLATGANYPAVSDRIVCNSTIPLPYANNPVRSLPEQKRIAAILDQADAIRRKRQQTVEISADLVPSLLYDLFGDLNCNSRGWPVMEFSQVCDSRLGKMLDAKQQTGMHSRPYMRNINVQWGKMDLSSVWQMDFDDQHREEFRLEPGDVLICEGGAGVGQTAIWRGELSECYFQKSLHRVRPRPDKAVPEYISNLIWALMKGGSILQHISQATIPHLTGVKLKSLHIPVPPLPLQHRFAKAVTQHSQLQERLRAISDESDSLFDSLVQRAFCGEL